MKPSDDRLGRGLCGTDAIVVFVLFVCFVVLPCHLDAQVLPAQLIVPAVPSVQVSPGEGAAVFLPPGADVPPEVLRALALQAASAGAPNASPSPDDQRLQAVLQLQFDRRPQELLQTLARQLDPASTQTNEVERFRDDVVAGRWPAVGEFIASLPEPQRLQVYRHLLTGLQRVALPGQPGMPEGVPSGLVMPGTPVGMPMPGMMPGMMPSPVLVPDDVLALADLSPGELTEDTLQMLGQLLSRALSKGNAVEPLVAQLERGTARLGGSDPAKRTAAVKLMVAAGKLNEAGRLLPALEVAQAAGDFAALDLHARYQLERGRQRQDTNALQTAWDLTQMLLTATNTPTSTNTRPPAVREQALRRALELLPLISSQPGSNWLSTSFHERPAQGMAILAAATAPPPDFRNAEARLRTLKQQHQAATALLAVVGDDVEPWRTPLTVLAMNWVQEADLSRTRWRETPQFSPGAYGFYDPEEQIRMQQMNDPNQPQPIAPAELLKVAPDARWLAQVDPSLAPRIEYLGATLRLKTDEVPEALAVVERLAPTRPRDATELAHELLHAWARTRNPSGNQDAMMRMRYGPYGPVYYGPGSPYGMGGQGIALTRAMQNRNLAELAGLIARLRQLQLPDLQEPVIVEAFTAAHSQAEVFRAEDLERVFGPVNDLRVETLTPLLQTMRVRLATSWRNMRVQQEAKTKRTDKDIEAEVSRGYEVLTSLLDQALARWPKDPRLHLVQAIAMFDFAEFQYGKKVDLPIYVEKREASFAAFQQAATLYADQLAQTEPAKYSADIYVNWFNANLGASDLAYVTRQQEPSTNNLQRIRDTILALPGEAGARHLDLFAAAINDSLNTIKAELKPRYVRAALRVTGELPAAQEVRKLAAYYDDLLGEIALDVRLDGDALVGHVQPFGVFVTLRHSVDVERESGGFGRYLQNQNQPYYGAIYGGPQRNAREDFEKQLREKLSDTFEIKVITFADDKVQSRGVGRPGWRETPLAYLLLQAKDGAVDRLPSFHFDLDFQDRRGQVVLPVESSIVLLDARPERGATRPVARLAMTQILDDREAAAGKLTLDLRATGRGVLPALPELLDVSLAGFTVVKTNDSGVAVTKLDTEGDDLAALSERSWVFELRPEGTGQGPATFKFPAAKAGNLEVTYKRYADADLVEVNPEVALAGLRLRPDLTWLWVTMFAAASGLAAWWQIRRRRGRAHDVSSAPAYTIPAQLTPFTLLNLLRRIQGDGRLALSPQDREELLSTIRELERDYFGPRRNGEPARDLDALARRWIESARP